MGVTINEIIFGVCDGIILNIITDTEYDLVDCDPHRYLNQAGARDLTGHSKHFGPLTVVGAVFGVSGAAVKNDPRDVGKCLDVIDIGRFGPQSGHSREWGSEARHAAFAFDRGNQGRFLAANEGSGAFFDLDVESEAGTENLVTQKTVFFRLGDSLTQPGDGLGVFGAAVNICLIGADRVSGDNHTFQNRAGIASKTQRSMNAPGSPSSALQMIFCHPAPPGEFPLETGRKTAAASSGKSG